MSGQTLRPLPDNIKQSQESSVGFERPIPESERTQTHNLDRPAKGIGFSVIYLFYPVIHSKQLLLEQHNKSQDSETN